MMEITPLIYTPTVGEACVEFSHIYRKPEGLVSHSIGTLRGSPYSQRLQYVSIEDKGNIRNVLRNWPKAQHTRITVVTDGSRILGLGDLGVNGSKSSWPPRPQLRPMIFM
jgi:malate dehydrogenase (oxaloacetate-decarboxylating)(NADP+)